MKIRVLIADDHPIVRDGLKLFLTQDASNIEIVGEAEDGVMAVARTRDLAPDIVIMDITMPRLNGLEAMREILRSQPRVRIIILSLHDARAFVEEALDAGARGYLTKEAASRNIVEAVREVYAGRFFLSGSVAHILAERAAGGKRGPGRRSGVGVLTPQERKVLQLIGEGRTGKEIALELNITANTVHTHRNSLMSKLGLHKQTDLVRYAVKEGLAKL